jgi:hypothetical protein
MKAYWGNGSIAPHIFDLCTICRWVVSFTPWSLYPQERVPGIHWIRGWVGLRAVLDTVVRRKIPSLPGIKPLINQPIAQRYTTGLPGSQTIRWACWLLIVDSKINTILNHQYKWQCESVIDEGDRNLTGKCKPIAETLGWTESWSSYRVFLTVFKRIWKQLNSECLGTCRVPRHTC